MDFVSVAKEFGAWAAGAFAAGWLAWFLLKEYIKARDQSQASLFKAMDQRIQALEGALRAALDKHEQALIYQRDELAALARAGHNRERILVELYRSHYQPHPMPAPSPEPETTRHPSEAETEKILAHDETGHGSRRGR